MESLDRVPSGEVVAKMTAAAGTDIVARISVIETMVGYIQGDVTEMKTDVKDMKNAFSREMVTQKQLEAELNPLRKLVYGAVGLVLTEVVTAVMFLLLSRD